MNSASVTGVETAANDVVRRTASRPATEYTTASGDGDGDGDGSATKERRKSLDHRKYRHVAAVHYRLRPSTLSHDATETPSFIGFRNLMVIVLVVGNLRLMIENIQKYGVLMCVSCHNFTKQDVLLGLVLYLLVPCCLFIAYVIELFAAYEANVSRRKMMKQEKNGVTSPTVDQQARFQATWHIIMWSHFLNITLALVVTSLVVYYYINHPLIGTMVEMHALIVWLKTASYALTNRDLRHAYLHPEAGELEALPELYASCPYPCNVTPGNLCYFWWAPTLVYQPVYPRTDKIRWSFVFKRIAEVFSLCVFMWVLSAQYAAPTLRNSIEMIDSLKLTSMVERLLKLSTISLAIWLAGFFALFQSFLNALAEMMRFGDRSFYDAWWNSDSLGTYWRTWNKPVYCFFRRHVFSPLMGRGYSPVTASLVVFVVSAFLHELAVGIPTHNIIGVAFAGMLFQIPLVALTRPLQKMHTPTGRLIGNCIFWISFTIFGQPFAALCYFYAWQAKYGSVSRRYGTTSSVTK